MGMRSIEAAAPKAATALTGDMQPWERLNHDAWSVPRIRICMLPVLPHYWSPRSRASPLGAYGARVTISCIRPPSLRTQTDSCRTLHPISRRCARLYPRLRERVSHEATHGSSYRLRTG